VKLMRQRIEELIELRNKIGEASDTAFECREIALHNLLVTLERQVIRRILTADVEVMDREVVKWRLDIY
jgi:hypothetical protein